LNLREVHGKNFNRYLRENVSALRDLEKEVQIRTAYGENYKRQAEIKKRYDPMNLFRMNQKHSTSKGDCSKSIDQLPKTTIPASVAAFCSC